MNPAVLFMGLTIGVGLAAGIYAFVRGRANRVYVQGGQLKGPGVTYVLTADDLLWLARAITGESGGAGGTPDAAIAWAIAQNFVLVRGSGGARPRFPTFTACIRAYAQPVNAEWANAASAKCQATPSACTPERVARRQALQSTPFASLPAGARAVVSSFATGSLSNPVPGLVDWAAYTFPGASVQLGGNWFGVGESRRLA